MDQDMSWIQRLQAALRWAKAQGDSCLPVNVVILGDRSCVRADVILMGIGGCDEASRKQALLRFGQNGNPNASRAISGHCLSGVSYQSSAHSSSQMVRVVPIIHRAPPPPPERPFEVPQADGSGSSQLPSRTATSANNSHLRRIYYTTRASSSSAPTASNSTSTSNGASGSQNGKIKAPFSLFDYLQELALTEAEFVAKLQEEGLELRTIAGDGNCMFRTVADQVYGDEEMHEQVRACCLDYMEQEADFFSEFVSTDFPTYLQHKRKLKVFGDHLELQAMAELYNRPVEIRIPGQKTLRICEGANDEAVVPLRLSYHNNNHYNSIRDPKNTQIGVGLGLPANQRPTTDKTMVAEALEQSLKTDAEAQILASTKLESEQDLIAEQMIADSAIKESELEDIDDQLLQQELEDELLAQQLQDQMDDDLEAAIRLSLQESNAGGS